MILPEDRASHDRMRVYCKAPMLMFGNQENRAGYDFGVKYKTLDLDGGDFNDCNLNFPIVNHEALGPWKTVYNIGTLEHVWNVHQAFVNAATIVDVGGFYLHCGPCAGWENHGIHVVDWRAVIRFFETNGFVVLRNWFTVQGGEECGPPVRGSGKSILLWFIAMKTKSLQRFVCPQENDKLEALSKGVI
jgi:hypothetical protein